MLYERIGLTYDYIKSSLTESSIAEYIKTLANGKALYPESMLHDIVSDSCIVAFRYYLCEDIKSAKKYIELFHKYLLEYFFGSWRDTTPRDGVIGRELWKRGNWTDDFRSAMLWFAALKYWDRVKKIAEYPTDECIKAEKWERDEFKAYYILLAAILRGERIKDVSKYVKIIESGKKKREKLLLAVLKPIVAGNAKKATEALAEYFKFYRKYEFTSEEFPEKLAIDGSILYHYARHIGINMTYPPEYEDHIVKFDSRKITDIKDNVSGTGEICNPLLPISKKSQTKRVRYGKGDRNILLLDNFPAHQLSIEFNIFVVPHVPLDVGVNVVFTIEDALKELSTHQYSLLLLEHLLIVYNDKGFEPKCAYRIVPEFITVSPATRIIVTHHSKIGIGKDRKRYLSFSEVVKVMNFISSKYNTEYLRKIVGKSFNH